MGECSSDGEDVDTSDPFEVLYRAEFSSLAAFAAMISGNRTAGEDIAQEAFARLAARWARVRHYQRPEGWLRLVTYRLARRFARQRHVLRPWADHESPTTSAEGPVVDSVDLVRAIRRHLTPRQRQMVALHYVYDRDVGEIATELGVSASNVRATLHNARQRLAVRLRASPPTGPEPLEGIP